MSKSGCCPPNNVISPENGQCTNRFEVMDELNRHYSERIDKIEKTGCTELLISNLKKWIEALVTHDKVLISTIESLESEALKRSEKITQLCKERLEVEDICQKYKKELCEKTDLFKELNCRVKDQAETLNQKECVIKRLNEELDKLRKCLDNLKNKSGNTCEDADLCKMKSQIECLKKELCSRESKIKSLEEDLCSCRRKLEEMQDASQLVKIDRSIIRRQSNTSFTTAKSESESEQLKDLTNQLNDLEMKIAGKDEKLKENSSKIQLLQSELDSKSKEEVKEKFIESQREIERLQKLLNDLKASGDSNTEVFRKNLENMKRESRDMKEALTTEVAEKHDMITSLRRDTAQLEEKARQADMQAIFKDDIIKELRKEVKLARAKESFVEMLGLNEGSRVQMKSKIDSLMAELEEKQCEIVSLENKLEEMNRHTLEGKLGELSLQLMDRERDMIILCNKVDYIKRYLDKLHEDEDLSIKCGLKALLLELNEETEWRRKARRSVTSLGDQPESVIIINRSNSLPTESSEHVRYNGRVNELELKLERAREEICCLRKKLESKESELACLKEKNDESEDMHRVDKVLLPDSMLSLKLEEFHRFTNESSKKLQETLDDIKQHAGNLLLKEDMEELDSFLNAEQETFFKANRQLHVLLCNIKNSNPGLATPANYKLQCLEKKLKSALDTLDRERTPDSCDRSENDTNNHILVDSMKNKIKDSLKLVCDLKQDAPEAADSVDPISSAGSTKLIQEIQEMIKIIQNQSKIQQSRLFALLDNQKEETGCLTKKFSEIDCLLRSHCKSINYVKDELKIALCNIIQKAEKVRKQVEYISTFECSVKDISNWINCNLKNNTEVVNKVNSLQRNIQQIKSMNYSLEESRKESKGCKALSSREPSKRKSRSTPVLVKSSCEPHEPELNDFEDKCLIARDLCDEVNKELDKAACRINQREQKLTHLSKDISCFGETICRLQDEIVRTAHALSGDAECSEEYTSYEEAALNLQETNKQLLQALHNLKHKLITHHREADNYDIKGIESRKTIAARLKELEESLHDISDILGEMKANEYMETNRAMSSESLEQCEEGEESDLSLVEVPSTVEKLHQMRRNMMEAACKGGNNQEVDDSSCTKNQMVSPEELVEEMRNEICSLNDTIGSLEKQNNCNQKTIETLKCQLVKAKEEADKTMQSMDKCAVTRLCTENKRLIQESAELRAMLQCKVDKINMLKREYIQLTDEVNQLTAVVQEEKESSKMRECALQHKNTELHSHVQWLKKKLQTVCHSISSAQAMEESSPQCGSNEQDDSKRKLQCLQEKYSCLLNQYKGLYNLHGKMQKAIKCSLEDKSPSGQTFRERRSEISREDTGCLTEENGETSLKLNDAMTEICRLKKEVSQLNCENERLNNENDQLIKDRHYFKQEYDNLMCEKQQLIKARDQCSLELEKAICQLHSNEEESYKLREENRCLINNNELISLENGDLKVELENSIGKYRSAEEKLRCLLDNYECLKKEHEKSLKEKQNMQNEMSDQCEKMNILRDEECRENMTMKLRYEEMRQQLKCAEYKIDDLEREISKVEKRNLETAMLEADTQLLITKTDQEWNEMYVKKCTEVMELTEEVECLRKKMSDINGKMMERNEMTNESKKVITVLKKTIQDYKTQIVCLKSKLDKCFVCNKEMKREMDSLEKSNRSMKQFIVFLNREKNDLIDKINGMQSEVSNCDKLDTSYININDEIKTYQKQVHQISNNNRQLFSIIQELEVSSQCTADEIKSMIKNRDKERKGTQ